MQTTLSPGGYTESVTPSPVKADGTPSLATLSNPVYVSSDTTQVTVANDPNNANGAIITSVSAPSSGTAPATVTGTFTATEADGVTTETVSGTFTVIVATPPPAPAAGITFTFGVPTAPSLAQFKHK